MTLRFVHESLPQRVRFASGEARQQLAAEVTDLGSRRAMLIAGPDESELADRIAGDLQLAVRQTEVTPHVPVALAERARAVAAEHRVDLLIAVGGGSTTGLAKAIALTSGIPIVAVPTTYAGSEGTSIWGLTDDGRKVTGRDPRVLPRAVIYDAELTLTLPAALSAASGLNAVAHCVDAFWAPDANPINSALAGEGLRALAGALPDVVRDLGDLRARERVLYGAYLAAVAFSSAGSGLHHKICHVLGGMFDLPHAATHAVVLPHVLALNGAAAPEIENRIADALGAATADAGLARLREALAAPRALRDLGMPESGIAPTAAAVFDLLPAGNPARVEQSDLAALLARAWRGELPA